MTTAGLFLGMLLVMFAGAETLSADEPSRPNIVYIMVDELGYFEPGFNGGRTIRTPHLDQMAKDGMQFRSLFAGSSVCAPTRCCFLTGLHSGHTSVRVNGGGTPLRSEEPTIASILKPLGYATGGFGKWGCGGRDSTGVPEDHGFDEFFGYYDQVHAHTYYPPYLIRNSEEVPLKGNNGGGEGAIYSHYLIHDAAMKFIREHAERPFFAYLPYTPPHGLFDIPDDDPAWAFYEDEPWPEDVRRYAAMVTMIDRQVGEVQELLRELKLEENTLLIFSGDNGGADYFASAQHPRGFHSANRHPQSGLEYRGRKGQLYEGGLRIPCLARWPGVIEPGSICEDLFYFPDFMPTFAELAGAEQPARTDGISLVPTLTGRGAQKQHEYLYWEIGGATAIRQGDWRAHRIRDRAWELYNVADDPGETNDVSAEHPEIVNGLAQLAETAHEPAREGTFSRTDRHERDRRAKTGRHDQPPENPVKVVRMPAGVLPAESVRLIAFSSQNQGNARLASHVLDRNGATHWHSRFAPDPAEPPHELVLDVGKSRQLKGVVAVSRQDQSWNGTPKLIRVMVSNSSDGLRQLKPVTEVELKRTKQPQVISFPVTEGRYVLFQILTEYGKGGHGSLSELGVIGDL
jgi:arylsulfatase A-like enzyme